MARYLIQSAETFEFLHFSPVRCSIGWTPSLLTALRHGVAPDLETVKQLIDDYSEVTTIVVNLDESES